MVDLYLITLIITLNINNLNNLIKKPDWSGWIKKKLVVKTKTTLNIKA